jgi:epoxyqueuosine reductase
MIMNKANFDLLNEAGLNMQVVFNLSELPEQISSAITEQVEDFPDCRQLLLIGHGGRRMWEAMQSSEFRDVIDPIDSFSIDRVGRWAIETLPEVRSEIIYPTSKRIVPLQALGRQAGWHHNSPFRIGINQVWGSWFAYRVAVLTDSDFRPTARMESPSPCDSCVDKPCLNVCPADALRSGDLSLKACLEHRLKESSSCSVQCPSRLACPIGSEHRYSMEQINYHYGRSLQSIREYQSDQ